MVTYAIVAGSYLSEGFSGIIPGITLSVSDDLQLLYVGRHNCPSASPFPSEGSGLLKDAIWGLLTVVIIMAGVISGVFTATESRRRCFHGFYLTFVIYREYPLKKCGILKRSLNTLAIVMILDQGSAHSVGYWHT